MLTQSSTTQPVARWRDRASSVLLVLAAIGAALSFIASIAAVADAGTGTRVVELWRTLGFFVFSGLFLLLAWRPRLYAGVWELAIADKAGLAIAGLVLGGNFIGATTAALVDGALAVALVAAYVLSKGYLAWGAARHAAESAKMLRTDDTRPDAADTAAGRVRAERLVEEHPELFGREPSSERVDRAA